MRIRAIIPLLACGVLNSGCHDPGTTIDRSQVKSILTLEVTGPATIPADGFTITTLTARIHPANATIAPYSSQRIAELCEGCGKLTDGASDRYGWP